MNSESEIELVIKASQTSNLLVQDLDELAKSEDLQTASLAAQLLYAAKKNEQQINLLYSNKAKNLDNKF